ncbi:retrovirus-related pol polyprotein from transposon TNT 1-94 [Tanacetum coccineum]
MLGRMLGIRTGIMQYKMSRIRLFRMEFRIQNGNGNVVAARDEGNGNGNNGNQVRCYNCRGMGHLVRNCTVRPRRRDVAYLQTQLLIAQKEEAGIQLQADEFDLMAAAGDLDEIEEVNANYILMANLQQASTSEEQYTELLEPISGLHQVQQYNSNVISALSSVEQSGITVDQIPTTIEETHALYDSLYNNLAIEVEKVNTINRKMKETNADLTTELARYKNQEKCFEINQEKYDKLERCYQKSVYQEQCLNKKINALHLSSAKQITTLNEKIVNLNNQLSKEKSTVSYLRQKKKNLKDDFKLREDELLNKQIQLEKKIKELDNILVKMSQSIQTMHMLSPKPDSFYHTEQKMALDTSNLQTELDHTKEKLETCINKKEKEYAVLWNDWIYENAKLRAQLFDKVSKQKDITKGTSVNTKFANQSTMGKPLLQPLRNHPVVRQPNAFQSKRQKSSKTRVPPKVVETNDLSNPATSNLVPITTEANVVKNDNVIAPGMFRINPLKTSREENFVFVNKVRASVRSKLITISQPHVITKKDVNSDSNGLSSTGVDNTAKTRRPQPRSNTKNDRVPSASKSSCIKYKEVEVEEHHRNLLLSKN